MNEETNGSKTTALPSDELFDVDEFACMAMAKELSHYKVSPLAHLSSNREKELQLLFKIAVASICHQFNWDFLNRRLAERLLIGGSDAVVNRMVSISAREFGEWFEDFSEPDRIRAVERAAILRNVGVILRDRFDGKASNIFQMSGFRLQGAGG